MKLFKYALVAALGFFGTASIVYFSSCEADPCNDLNCKNGGSCADGYCQCPTGYEGSECEIMAADRFVGKYAGLTRCGIYPAVPDTVTIVKISDPDKVNVKGGFGRTSLLSFDATARTPALLFSDYNDGSARVHPSATIDNKELTIYVETLNLETHSREVCTFIGTRISDSTGG